LRQLAACLEAILRERFEVYRVVVPDSAGDGRRPVVFNSL
jgi:hypothetical protein